MRGHGPVRGPLKEGTLAIYHLTANIISRGRGQSAVAAAAYRSGTTLRDRRYGVTHSYNGKRGILQAEIMTPPEAPAWASDREALWNTVEAREPRKDSQLARLIEISLPVELSADERVALVRDYIAQEFVAKGMIADFSVRGEANNPHAHILLTLRRLTPAGFGPKERGWNGKSALLNWRAAWAARANEHLARAGHAVRIDHRTLEAQQIELTPGRRIGIGRARQAGALPAHLSERIAEQQDIAQRNGATILEDPTVALRALTHQRPIFSHRELVEFLHSRTRGASQLGQALQEVMGSGECVALDPQAGLEGRFTSRDMIEAEASLIRRALSMAARRGHGVSPQLQEAAAAPFAMDGAQRAAFEHLAGEGDAKAAVGDEDLKRAVLSAARTAWDALGLSIIGAAHSEGAALALEALSGIRTRSNQHWEDAWQQGQGLPGKDSVLLLDGCQHLGLKLLERWVAAADKARAKIVLWADAQSLWAMKAEPPFCNVWRRIGPPGGITANIE